jgi:glycosyltransferase involved in cell wall biosynthesis
VRIALLTYRGNMFCGGQGIYAAEIARALHALGHRVHVIAGPPLPELAPGIPLHVIPNENFFGRPLAEALPGLAARRALRPGNLWELGVSRLGVFPEMTAFGVRLLLRWRALMARHRFDVVLDNQSLTWGLLGIQAAGTPVVGMVHHPLHIDRLADFELDPSFKRKWRRTLYFPMLMQEFVVPRLAGIATVSQASRLEIERCFGVPRARIAVCPNGTDTEVFRPLERTKQTDLIFVGRTEDRKKGVSYLLDALARTPQHITLKIVDGRIPDDGLVMRKLRAHRLEARVALVRRMLTVEELVAEYSTARIALVPSFFEGFGFPASEAMACGLPVIATDAGALPEVVGTSGETGRLVPFRDVGALAAAIAELGTLAPDTVAKMGAAARQRVQRVFRWRDAALRTAEALAGAARAHRRS